MNVSFTDKQEKYISTQVQSGDYQNASEVVRSALRLHQNYRERILEDLRQEISKGWDGATSTKKLDDILKEKIEAHSAS